MKVTLVSCVFPPEPVVSSQTSGEIARGLAERGHDVTVVTPFPSRPDGRLFSGYSRRLYRRERAAEGYRLVRCFSTVSSESRPLSRLMENLTFGVTAAAAVLTGPRPDVIYANTWPLFATLLLYLVARLRRVPIVVSVQDIYPESLVSQGRLTDDNLLVRSLRWLDGKIAAGARALIVISERFSQIYTNDRQVPPERVHIVHNWVEQDLIGNESREAFRRTVSIPDEAFLIVYGGNIGAAAGVETLVQAGLRLESHPQIHILIAGGGSRLDHCRRVVQEAGGTNITFHTPWPKSETSSVLRAADLLVLPTRGAQSLASVPSKLISYMLAGRPVLALGSPTSDIAQVINASGCGWLIPPDDPEALAQAILEAAGLSDVARGDLGAAGRRYALDHFTGDVCLPRVMQILEQAA